jgi:predicted ATPase
LCRAIQGQQCINKNNLHTCLKRDDDNKLITSFVVCPKNIKIDKIKNNYILRDFPNELLSIELSTKFFSKILPKNKSILLKNFLILIEKNNFQHGFFIYGDNGIGKTYSCIAFANALALKEKKIAFVFMTELLLKLKNGFNTFNANQELIDNIKKSDVLFLDDFGANHKNF